MVKENRKKRNIKVAKKANTETGLWFGTEIKLEKDK
jgi:hypothetical protein